MTDKERNELVEQVELIEDVLASDVEGLVKQAKRVEYAVKSGYYRKKDLLQLNELVGLCLYAFDRAECYYDVERVKVEMKNQSNS